MALQYQHSYHHKLLSVLHKWLLSADTHGVMDSFAQEMLCQHGRHSPTQIVFFLDLSDIVCATIVKTQHFNCTPTWMLFLQLAFALLDEQEPTCFPAMQAQPASTQASHPQREAPGLTGNLTKAPVSEHHQQLPGQLLCLTPSVVICAGRPGQHCQAGLQRWHCQQLLAQQQYCCPNATTCNHHEL